MWLSGKRICLQCRRCSGDPGFNPRIGKIPWRRKWQPAPVFLPGESHGEWSLVGYSLWVHKELDTTEGLNNKQGLGRSWRVCLPLWFLLGAASQWRISSPRCEKLVWCWIDQKSKVKIRLGKIKQTQNSKPNKTRQMFLLGNLRTQCRFVCLFFFFFTLCMNFEAGRETEIFAKRGQNTR